MATIKDIAKKSGFSVCTVSRALAGKGYLKETTKQIILETAKQCGYRPNSTAKNLKTGKSNQVALIIPDVTNMYYPRLEKYIARYTTEKGYIVHLYNSDNGVENEKSFIETIIKNQVSGAIVVPCSNTHSHFMELQKYNIPYVFMNRSFEDDLGNCIRTDNFQGGYDCIKYLIKRGKKTFGCLFQSFNNMIYEERYKGAIKAFCDCEINKENISFLFDLDDWDKCSEILKGVFQQGHYPEAFFAANDMLAFAVYKAAYIVGVKIPDDISIIGYDDIIMADKIIPPLTTYHLPAKEMCRMAVDHLLCQINGEKTKSSTLLRGTIIERDSVS